MVESTPRNQFFLVFLSQDLLCFLNFQFLGFFVLNPKYFFHRALLQKQKNTCLSQNENIKKFFFRKKTSFSILLNIYDFSRMLFDFKFDF